MLDRAGKKVAGVAGRLAIEAVETRAAGLPGPSHRVAGRLAIEAVETEGNDGCGDGHDVAGRLAIEAVETPASVVAKVLA